MGGNQKTQLPLLTRVNAAITVALTDYTPLLILNLHEPCDTPK